MEATLQAAAGFGVTRLILNSRWRSRRLLILCYHGFSLHDEHNWDPELFITGARLRRRFEHLRESRCSVLSLSDGLECLRRGTLPHRAVCLTVDDGFYDFLAVAYPLIQEFAFPVTVYVTTYHVEHPLPVFNVMSSYLFWKASLVGRHEIRVRLLGDQPLPIATRNARLDTWNLLKT